VKTVAGFGLKRAFATCCRRPGRRADAAGRDRRTVGRIARRGSIRTGRRPSREARAGGGGPTRRGATPRPSVDAHPFHRAHFTCARNYDSALRELAKRGHRSSARREERRPRSAGHRGAGTAVPRITHGTVRVGTTTAGVSCLEDSVSVSTTCGTSSRFTTMRRCAVSGRASERPTHSSLWRVHQRAQPDCGDTASAPV
jgi:hypothetical protein